MELSKLITMARGDQPIDLADSSDEDNPLEDEFLRRTDIFSKQEKDSWVDVLPPMEYEPDEMMTPSERLDLEPSHLEPSKEPWRSVYGIYSSRITSEEQLVIFRQRRVSKTR